MNGGDVIGSGRHALQKIFLFGEHLVRASSGLAVDAHIGDLIKPLAHGWSEHLEVTDLESGEEVFFDIADAGLDATFLVSGADITGHNVEALMA